MFEIKDPKEVKVVVSKVLKKIGMFILEKSKENMDRIVPKMRNTGYLRRSGGPENMKELSGGGWQFGFEAPYASFVEFGTGVAVGHKPYMPPEAPIKEWVKRKLKKKGKELDRVTKAVQFHIFKEGIRARPFFRPAIDEARRLGLIK